jgi:hypothetical protein
MGIHWMVRGLVPVHFGQSPVKSRTASYPLVHLVAIKAFFHGLFQSSVFFFHFCKVACWATSALHAVLNWLRFRFFLAPLPKYLSPSGCHIIVKVKFLALLSDLKEKKSGHVSN